MLPLSRCGRWLSRKRFSALALKDRQPGRRRVRSLKVLRTRFAHGEFVSS
jgi:hypothetical protein